MKLNPTSMRQLTSDAPPYKPYVHPWYTYLDLKRPNPPTPEAVKKAAFKDKTYVWKTK